MKSAPLSILQHYTWHTWLQTDSFMCCNSRFREVCDENLQGKKTWETSGGAAHLPPRTDRHAVDVAVVEQVNDELQILVYNYKISNTIDYLDVKCELNWQMSRWLSEAVVHCSPLKSGGWPADSLSNYELRINYDQDYSEIDKAHQPLTQFKAEFKPAGINDFM